MRMIIIYTDIIARTSPLVKHYFIPTAEIFEFG